MKKHFYGGKNAYERIAGKIFLFLCLITFSIFPQSEFEKSDYPLFSVERYNTSFNNNKIAVFNIDNEPPYDLIFYDNGRNEFTYHSFAHLNKAKRKFFFFPIDEIKLIKPAKKNDERFYIFTSRTKNVVGLASFTKYGTLRLLNKRVVPSYPSKILVGNFLAIKAKRALIFGDNFNGVSLFSVDKYSLKFESVINSGFYSEGGLLDLDADGMNDLILYNPISMRSEYYLNLLNKFEITYADTSAYEIKNLKTIDLNGDKLIDYAFTNSKGITAYLTRSNPKNKIEITIPAKDCKDYVFSDFTFDYKKDLLYTDNHGNLFYSIRKNEKEFSVPWFLRNVYKASAISSVWNKDRREIIVLSKKGFFEKYSPVNSIDTTLSLLLPDIKRSLNPIIDYSKNQLKIFWLSDSFPLVYSLKIKSNRFIKEKQVLPFTPQKLLVTNVSKYLLTENDSTFTIRSANPVGEKIALLPKNKFILNDNIFINISDSTIYIPPDTLRAGFSFDSLISFTNKNFVFAKKNNILFAKRIANDSLIITENREVADNVNIYPLYSKDKNDIVIISNDKFSISNIDTINTFTTNYNFSNKKDLVIFEKIPTSFFIYDKTKGSVYKTRKIRKNYISFSKVLINHKLKSPGFVTIKSKTFLVGFNERKKTIDFIEIK